MDKIYILLSVAAIPAIAASIARITITGFQPSMLIHAILVTALIAICFYRKRISLKIKLYFLLILSARITIIGLYNWGLLGNGFLWSVMVVIFATLCFGLKQGLTWAGILTAYAIIIRFFYTNDMVSTGISPDIYASSYSAWATAIFGSLLPLLIVSMLVGTLYETAKKMIYKLEEQRVKITILAERDNLTGLYNARMFYEFIAQSLERSKRHESWMYVFNMDLNGFKAINDKHGHHADDLILKYVAKQMLNVTRAEDTLCRVGGDEFLMLSDYPKKPSDEDTQELINRLKNACQRPRQYGNHKLRVTISIGYAAYNTKETPALKTDDDILKLADRAMYRDKQNSRTQAQPVGET